MNKNLKKLCKKNETKCYELLYGRKEPCEGCPLLKKNAEGREDEVYSPKLNRYFLRYYKIFQGKTGKVLKLTFYADITEKIRLFEEAGIPLVVTDWEGKILRVNKRARELLAFLKKI